MHRINVAKNLCKRYFKWEYIILLYSSIFILIHIDPNRAAQIEDIFVEENIKLLSKYANYAKVFTPDKTIKLPEQNLMTIRLFWKKSKIPLYRPIYSLKALKLKVLRVYIKTNLNNIFIQASTSPAVALIFWNKKASGGL